MLEKNTVAPGVLELLKKLMKEEALTSFCLADGTALALQIGHRISIDIDLFSESPFNSLDLSQILQANYGFLNTGYGKNTLHGTIEGIKIDILTHGYPYIRPWKLEEGIRMASIEDIIAMKLNAIIISGTRVKDFYDIAELSSRYSLKEMQDAFYLKYQIDPVNVLRALPYYQDVIHEETIQTVSGLYSWENVKSTIGQMIKFPNRAVKKL